MVEASDPSHYCNTIPTCGLTIEKTATPDVIEPSVVPSCKTHGKPVKLTFRFEHNDGCSSSDHERDGKQTECSGKVDHSHGATVSADDGKSHDYVVDKNYVREGETFTISSDNFGSMHIKLSNSGGEEHDSFHAACDEPLKVGDVFGSLKLVAYNDMQAPSNEVTYEYVVINDGDPLTGVILEDDKLGTIAGPLDLATGQSETITKTAIILETTTNTVTANGMLANGVMCPASATATVIVKTAPPPKPCHKKEHESCDCKDKDGSCKDNAGNDHDYSSKTKYNDKDGINKKRHYQYFSLNKDGCQEKCW
jgi:hypothetical protein